MLGDDIYLEKRREEKGKFRVGVCVRVRIAVCPGLEILGANRRKEICIGKERKGHVKGNGNSGVWKRTSPMHSLPAKLLEHRENTQMSECWIPPPLLPPSLALSVSNRAGRKDLRKTVPFAINLGHL